MHWSTQQLPEPAEDSLALHPKFKSFPWNIFVSLLFLNLFCLRQTQAALRDRTAKLVTSVVWQHLTDYYFRFSFSYHADAKASRNQHTSLLNPTELGNQRLQILNFCSPHPTKTGYYLPCKQAGSGGTEWLSDYSSITAQVWESQELNLYFLHLSLRLSVLFCVAALILSWRGRLGSLKSLSLLLWLTGDVANGTGIVAFPTSKGGTQCVTSVCWKKH